MIAAVDVCVVIGGIRLSVTTMTRAVLIQFGLGGKLWKGKGQDLGQWFSIKSVNGQGYIIWSFKDTCI